jgi:glycine C-acetyltransferase
MYESVRDDLRSTLDEIRAAGLFKPERVISTSQSASVGVVSGAATGSSRQRGAIAARPSMTAVQA